ncbi:MAG: glycosyltransferase [Candidatus Diapherotrites archaeon]|nr:glycosyltransferase [Candidatus Diapherotrites archaeon]
MNILKFSKYPPIEGGESSKAYWRSKAIGERKNKIFLVTNAFEVEENCRIALTGKDLEQYQPKNVKVFNTSPFEMPSFFPSFNPMTEKLISKGIEVIENNDIDLIEGSYLMPYCFAAHYLAKEFKKPLVITHAGSDMTRILNSEHYYPALKRVINSADRIITFKGGSPMFTQLGVKKKNIVELSSALNSKAFSPNVVKVRLSKFFGKKPGGAILTHFGKIHKSKGIYELIDSASKVKGDFSILFFGAGKNKADFQKFAANKGLSSRVFFHDFVPPWIVPSIIKASDCLLSVEHNFGVEIHGPIMPREVLSVGKPVLVSNEINLYHSLEEFDDGIIKVNPGNRKEYIEKLSFIVSNRIVLKKIGKNGREWVEKNNNFKKYIDETIGVYKSLI